MVGQKIKRENLARYYGGIINSGEWYLADKADQVMDALELQHNADAELIAADRRNMEQMKNRIKVLEVINKDLINDRDKIYSIYETRIKELEDELGRVTDAQISSKDELGQLGTELGTDHFVDANKMMWVSVKDRLPETNLEVLIWIDGIGVQRADYYVEDGGFYVNEYRHPSYWMPLPPPPTAEEGK